MTAGPQGHTSEDGQGCSWAAEPWPFAGPLQGTGFQGNTGWGPPPRPPVLGGGRAQKDMSVASVVVTWTPTDPPMEEDTRCKPVTCWLSRRFCQTFRSFFMCGCVGQLTLLVGVGAVWTRNAGQTVYSESFQNPHLSRWERNHTHARGLGRK